MLDQRSLGREEKEEVKTMGKESSYRGFYCIVEKRIGVPRGNGVKRIFFNLVISNNDLVVRMKIANAGKTEEFSGGKS